MIVSSNTHFPKDYKTGYKYCLMVNRDNKVYMVWNYTARDYMDIRNLEGVSVNSKYSANQIKKLYKTGDVGFYFVENPQYKTKNNKDECPF